MWMPFGRKMINIVFLQRVHIFLMVITLSRTNHFSYKRVSNEYSCIDVYILNSTGVETDQLPQTQVIDPALHC